MFFLKVEDSSIAEVREITFDLAIFSVGYEERCTSVAQNFNLASVGQPVGFAFDEHSNHPKRVKNQTFFVDARIPIRCGEGSSEDFVYEQLNELTKELGEDCNILVDYTSMSKTWYGSIINFFVAARKYNRATIYFCYQPGRHESQPLPKAVESISVMAGYQGSITSGARDVGKRAGNVGLFGLGFEPWSVFAAFERIEPDRVFAVYANPGSIVGYEKLALDINKEFINSHVRPNDLIGAPITSVQGTFRLISELVVFSIGENWKVSFAPLGPKAHCFAFLLSATRFSGVSVVQVTGEICEPRNVLAVGVPVITKVEFVCRDP